MCAKKGLNLGVAFAKCVRIIFVLFVVINTVGRAVGLKLTNMSAPAIADPREDMSLDCHFDMGNEQLYAVKWYKDDHEFFRYMPYQEPYVRTYPVAGVQMLQQDTSCGHNRCKIRLTALTRHLSGGAYRCEVSSDAPAFRLASETHNVKVAALPRENPMMFGIQNTYQLGDMLVAECKSSEADPLPDIQWYINDVKAPSNVVGDSISSPPDELGLAHRSVTMRFQIDRKYTQGNFIRLRCVSTVPGLPTAPQTVSQTVIVKAQPSTQVNNEKLHWPDASNKAKLQINSPFMCTVIAYYFVRMARW